MEKKVNEFERLTKDVVLIDGKHYRAMTDEETADFVWGNSEKTQRGDDLSNVPLKHNRSECK